MRSIRHILVVWFLLLALVSNATLARAEDSLEKAAQVAQSGIATVRVLDVVTEAADPDDPLAKEPRPRVTVCTGVCVEKGWMVTPAFAGSDSQIRLTLPGGEQSSARLRVIDEYSGLALIEADTKDLKPLKPAAAESKIGAWVISAAAWGVEKPVISLGILSGHDRTEGGMQYPPLLQADLRTTETSSGAALVNRDGELLGVIVLVNDNKEGRGFTFAVPVSHVQRLLRARVERPALVQPMDQQAKGTPEARGGARERVAEIASVVVLKRRRPVVGMVMAGGPEESVFVERVIKGSPADKVGIKVGDVVTAIDGIHIRSVTQGVKMILYKQPGDVVTYDVRQGDVVRRIDVVLGGGVELPGAPAETLGQYIRPKVDIQGVAPGRQTIVNASKGEVREVYGPGEAGAEQRSLTPAEKIKLLEKANDGYRSAITYQQRQLIQREEERRQMELRIEDLEKQVEELKQSSALPSRSEPSKDAGKAP